MFCKVSVREVVRGFACDSRPFRTWARCAPASSSGNTMWWAWLCFAHSSQRGVSQLLQNKSSSFLVCTPQYWTSLTLTTPPAPPTCILLCSDVFSSSRLTRRCNDVFRCFWWAWPQNSHMLQLHFSQNFTATSLLMQRSQVTRGAGDRCKSRRCST